MGCALGALALSALGCGAEEHANEPRPQPPTRVSVTVTPRAITVQPPRIAVGPEPSQQIPQNQHAGQPPDRLQRAARRRLRRRQPDRLRLEAGGARAERRKSGLLVANGNDSLLAALPTGVYTVSAADIPSAKPVRFAVGPYRSSSQNDVLLP